jgi:hypothetical protein
MGLITETGDIKMGARAAWHWAFDSGINSIDMREVLDHFGVQFSAKGADGQIMAHCEKARIQQVIYKLRIQHRAAWAWGMTAYAPDGSENISLLRNILLEFAFRAVATPKFNPYMSHEAGKIAFIAISDAAIESRRGDGQRYKRKRSDMAAMLRCDVEAYKRDWSPKLYAMKDALKDLDGVCLPPVFDALAMMADKALRPGDSEAIDDFATAMKTPA